jgi:eukaryotic-like serine/threonine-protein kinase
MESERWQTIKKIYEAARDHDPTQRKAVLDKACAEDEELRREVNSLLAVEDSVKDFIEAPAIEAVARALAEDEASSPGGHAIGGTVSHYRVLEQLGTGGMGVVYKAWDLRLERFVALKFIPQHHASNRDAHERFMREARSVAALDHPNICTIYDIGEHEGLRFIAMQLLEGETLRTRLAEKPLNIEEIFAYGIQIANGLDAAHGKGIVHRDVKPANIFIAAHGQLKLLDFGIASDQRKDHSETTGFARPTITGIGAVVGTVGYMSPEQAEGLDLDARTDVFSLGVVLYEMATGVSAFGGRTTNSILEAILNKTPTPPIQLNPKIPVRLQEVIFKALDKNRETRYQTAADLSADLKQLKTDTESQHLPVRTRTPQPGLAAAPHDERKPLQDTMPDGSRDVAGSRTRHRWLLVGVSAFVVTSVFALIGVYPSSKDSSPLWRSVPFTSYLGIERNPAISPDSSAVAFTWNGTAQDNFDIYVQPVKSGPPQRLTTDPAEDSSPAWSDDGKTIAFLRRVQGNQIDLVLVPSIGGPEHVLTQTRTAHLGGNWDSTLDMNLSWAPGGQWIAVAHKESMESRGSLYLVSVLTGDKRRLTEPPLGYFDQNPAFSPDGSSLAFSRGQSGNSRELYSLPLSGDFVPSGLAKRLVHGEGSATHPAWTRGGLSIVYALQSGLRVVSTTGSGTLESVRLESGSVAELSLGRHLVYSQSEFDPNIWRAEIPLTGSTPSSPQMLISSTRLDNSAQYSPDGRKIAFLSSRSGTEEIWICNSDGSNPIQLTSFGSSGVRFPRWAPDGQRLVFHARAYGQADLFSIAATGGMPSRLTTDPSDDILASFSRNGRWIYFASNRSGQSDIWKIPSTGGEATQLTFEGGTMPLESVDGKDVFYAGVPAGKGLWKIPIRGGTAVQVTAPIAKDVAFAVNKEGIYYVAPPESASRQLIHFLNFSTGQNRPVVVADREIGLGLSLSHDGRFLIFPQRDRAGSDLWLIKDFSVR